MKKLILALVCFGLPASASATLIGVSGELSSAGFGAQIIDAPASVIDDTAEASYLQAFDEAQGVLLTSDLAVDGGLILAGTVVNSHMVFLEVDGNARTSHGATFEFDGDVLGVMSDRNGNLEAASSALLGAAGTIYPAAFSARGLEGNDSYSFIGSSISVDFTVTEPGDWIRVVTASEVPEPSTVVLLGLALAGFVTARKRANA